MTNMGNEFRKFLAAAIFFGLAVYASAANGVRVCDWSGCYISDPPAGVTVNNACELVLSQITVTTDGNIAFCGYTEHETNELTIEILDHH